MQIHVVPYKVLECLNKKNHNHLSHNKNCIGKNTLWGPLAQTDVRKTWDLLGQVDPRRSHLTIVCPRVCKSSEKWFTQIKSINYFMPHEGYLFIFFKGLMKVIFFCQLKTIVFSFSSCIEIKYISPPLGFHQFSIAHL